MNQHIFIQLNNNVLIQNGLVQNQNHHFLYQMQIQLDFKNHQNHHLEEQVIIIIHLKQIKIYIYLILIHQNHIDQVLKYHDNYQNKDHQKLKREYKIYIHLLLNHLICWNHQYKNKQVKVLKMTI